MKQNELVALIDMDGTVADFDGQMQRDLEAMRGPDEAPYEAHPGKHPRHIEARMRIIKQRPGWWRELPTLRFGMRMISALKSHGLTLNVLTKGPFRNTPAWTEKVEWCREHLPGVAVTITEDKGLSYGKVLMDDYPPYIERWLEWRPRGLVIMPDQKWNKDFTHPNVIRWDGSTEALTEITTRLKAIVEAP